MSFVEFTGTARLGRKTKNLVRRLGPGDVAIMDLVEDPVTFVDTRNNTRSGKVYLKPVQTVTAGVPFGRPYNAPFSVR